MRKITLYQKGSSNIELFDDSDMNMDEYCEELSKLFQVNNITILKTTSSIFLTRPSKLTGINVEEVDEIEETGPDFDCKAPDIEYVSGKEETKEAEEIDEDIITDMD